MHEPEGLEPLTDAQKAGMTPEQIERWRRVDAELKRRAIEGEPEPIRGSDAIRADEINRHMRREDLSIPERISAANAIARYPIRIVTDSPGPQGRIYDDPTHLREEIDEDRRRRGLFSIVFGEAYRLSDRGERSE